MNRWNTDDPSEHALFVLAATRRVQRESDLALRAARQVLGEVREQPHGCLPRRFPPPEPIENEAAHERAEGGRR